jgi:hypothetical protein
MEMLDKSSSTVGPLSRIFASTKKKAAVPFEARRRPLADGSPQ